MILYLDASALVKRYVAELGSANVAQVIAQADLVGTVLVSRAEVAAALAKAARMNVLTAEEAREALEAFRTDWPDLIRLQVTEMVVARADLLAWEHRLRSYDAIHLAAALLWQDAMGERVTMATFDRSLWAAARQSGLIPYPADLPLLLEGWKRQGESPSSEAP